MSTVFFLDRALGKYTFPQKLRDAGIRVERHCDHFAHDDPDIHWIEIVAAHGWYAKTGASIETPLSGQQC